jgi:hypothetical protein
MALDGIYSKGKVTLGDTPQYCEPSLLKFYIKYLDGRFSWFNTIIYLTMTMIYIIWIKKLKKKKLLIV